MIRVARERSPKSLFFDFGNPSYGYLWWVNRNAYAPNRPSRIAIAPKDMFSANGALNRRCFVVPSLQLVVTRLGAALDDGRSFDRKFWRLLMDAWASSD